MKNQEEKGEGITIWQAIKKDDAEKLESFNDDEINQLGEKGYHAIHFAASNGAINCLEHLIKTRKIDASLPSESYKYTPLHFAAQEGHVKAIELLLENGAAIDAQTEGGVTTPLHEASYYGQVGAIECLLCNGAEIRDEKKFFTHRLNEKSYNKIVELINASEDLKKICELHNQEDIVAEDADQTTLDLIPSNDNEVDVDHIGETKDHSDALA